MTDHDSWTEDEVLDRPRRGRTLLAVAFVLMVLAGLYAAAALYFGDKVPADTRIGGVAIGGKTPSEAQQALEDELSDEEARPVTVTVDGKEVELEPADAGLSYDYAGSVDGLTGFSLNPVDLWHHVRGGVERDVEVAVDEQALADAVDAKTSMLDKEPVEGKVTLEGATVKKTASKPGLSVDRDAVVESIADEWPAERSFDAPTTEPAPQLTQAEIDRFAKDDLEPLVAGPVTVTTTDPQGEGEDKTISFTVPADQLAGAVSIKDDKGRLSASVDEAKVAKATLSAGSSSGLFREAKDAGVVHRGGSDFDVTPSSTGLALKEDGLGAKVVEAMKKKGDERKVAADSQESQPELTTAEAKKTLPQEELSTFTTYLPDAGGVRTNNIKIAARQLDGAYVAPGETFSLNQQLGQRTAAKGYQKAGVISGGRLTNDYGGGISQLSTTLFNAVFFSGAKIEEFHPHSFYISRYPEGREATISWPDVDNRFTNDTGAGILISASVSGNEVTVTFHGRKKYDEIKATKSARKNITPPKTITDNTKGCVPQSPAPGFSVDIGRQFIKDGKTVKSSSFTTRYIPQDDVTCTNP
ncbi:von Willebrand factor A [Janibacter hoylei PVAS-1]|uniref:VanW domain-containing protein n=1 Tax=Janibacter hoylei PVAS-1 TaxID=1210046 RepID=K1EBS1_9MICO|nr:VanW domain-containing protein [Janibacter hoylei]EKA62812.1 von Willebrand factor A [Janibacter hoylei PVAS-1]RWU82089.1 VanW domain-containing protein [Janibacter hoylei PVAS-1]